MNFKKSFFVVAFLVESATTSVVAFTVAFSVAFSVAVFSPHDVIKDNVVKKDNESKTSFFII